jgi:copper(I)-binding protein
MKTNIRFVLVTLLASLILASCNSAAGELNVKDAWARPTVSNAQATSTMSMGDSMTKTNSMDSMNAGPVSAAYMVIENKTNSAEKLIDVNASIADVAQVHETKQTSDGMMGMQQVQGGLDIPAQSSVTLKPGSYHIMLMGLHQDLSVGQSFSLTLTFQSGKKITLDVPVKQQP